MDIVADILLVAGALGAGFYCFVLARRLNRFNDLEKGVGGAIAVLSSQVDDLSSSLLAAREASNGSNDVLQDLTGRAEKVATRLELMIASLHDVPEEPTDSDSLSKTVLPEQASAPAGPIFMRHPRRANGAEG
jgi:hypothetical protein